MKGASGVYLRSSLVPEHLNSRGAILIRPVLDQASCPEYHESKSVEGRLQLMAEPE